MTWILKEKWFWITVISALLIVFLPFLIIFFILNLSPETRFVATILIIIVSGVAAGYREWIIEQSKKR
jgi:hypothetical protein